MNHLRTRFYNDIVNKFIMNKYNTYEHYFSVR